MTRLAIALATAGGAGYVPWAPGTAGSLVGVALFFLLRSSSPVAQLIAIAAVTIVGVWAATVAERHFGRKDPGPVVIDEVAGQLITLCVVATTTAGVLAGFLLFRAYDIVKPWPVRQLERLGRGPGIMADDVMAGLYAHGTLRLLAVLAPGWLS